MKNVYLFHGEDSFRSQSKAKFWRDQFIKKYGDLNIQIIAGEDLTANEYLSATETLPFLSDKKLIIIKNAFAETSTDELKKIADKIENTPEHCIVVFTESNKADARTGLFKKIKKFGEINEHTPLDTIELNKWIEQEATKMSISIANPQINYLALSIGPNLWQLKNELQKLQLYSANQTITNDQIDRVISPNLQSSIFKLTDALSAKKPNEALNILHVLLGNGENIIQIIFMIVRNFRILIQIKDCLEKGLKNPEIIKKTKLHPFVVNNAVKQAKNFDHQTLKCIYDKLLQTDINLKSGKIKISTNDNSELQMAIEKIIVQLAN